MTKLTDKKQRAFFCLLCCAIYFVSYLERFNYSALLNPIIAEGTISRQMAAAISTAAFVTYGVGQVVCGFLGDKTDPKRMIALGLFGTSLCNAGMFFSEDAVLSLAIWSFNGLFQAMLWPPLVRIAADLLEGDEYHKTIQWTVIGGSLGSVAVYLLAAGTIALQIWKWTYLVTALFGVFALLFWKAGLARLPEAAAVKADSRQQGQKNGKKNGGLALFLPLLPVAFMIIMHGILKDGLTTWMPGYLTEVFSLTPALSAAVSAALPLFAIVGVRFAALIFRKNPSEVKNSLLLFGFSAVLCILLYFFFDAGVAVPSLCMALVIGCMHSVNALLIAYLPLRFASVGAVSTVAGLLNACTYVGSALSIYGIALATENMGWQFTVALWALVSLAALAVGVTALRMPLPAPENPTKKDQKES